MKPTTSAKTTNQPADEAADSADSTWHLLQAVTDQNRANITADIVGHPTMITVAELDYMNPDLGEDAIRHHLSVLEDAGVVSVQEFGPGERQRDLPYKFYTLTDEARTLFDELGLFPEEAWQRQYQSVEKTPTIRRIETMPRP